MEEKSYLSFMQNTEPILKQQIPQRTGPWENVGQIWFFQSPNNPWEASPLRANSPANHQPVYLSTTCLQTQGREPEEKPGWIQYIPDKLQQVCDGRRNRGTCRTGRWWKMTGKKRREDTKEEYSFSFQRNFS